MGLIKHIVLLPVAPVRFTVWVAEQVTEETERREFSAGAGVQKIEEIEEKRERGEISEEEAAEQQGAIIEQQVERAKPQAEPEEGERDG